jgi:hypothetical protein
MSMIQGHQLFFLRMNTLFQYKLCALRCGCMLYCMQPWCTLSNVQGAYRSLVDALSIYDSSVRECTIPYALAVATAPSH